MTKNENAVSQIVDLFEALKESLTQSQLHQQQPLVSKFRKLCSAFVENFGNRTPARDAILKLWRDTVGEPGDHNPFIHVQDDATCLAVTHDDVRYELWCGSSQEISMVVSYRGEKAKEDVHAAEVSPEITTDDDLELAMKGLVHVA